MIKKRRFPGPRPQRGVMNKLESQYAVTLESMKQRGEILDYQFEAITFKLGHRCTYTPDFLVVFPDHFEIHEVKGHWREAARVRIKVAASLYPWFRFVAVTERKRGVFEYEEIAA